MSISDLIVVMKEGVVQQIGKPQAVYDAPANLFVAKFLGNPPINLFRGRAADGQLYIGGAAVLPLPGAPAGEVLVGVRPEGFVLDAGGPLACGLRGVEVMGRDISVVCTHPDAEGPTLRAIIGAENQVDHAAAEVRFALKPDKVYVFDPASEQRIG